MTDEELAEMKRPISHGPQALWTLREQKQTLLAEVQRLQKRLKVAEDVATMLGWTAVEDGDRSKAAGMLYSRWYDLVGADFAGPDAHPDLNTADLAREYDESRARNLAHLTDDKGPVGMAEFLTDEERGL